MSMWLDRVETRLNACSLEVSGPLPRKGNATISRGQGNCRQAVLVGCYELLQPDSDAKLTSPDSQPLRKGEIMVCFTECSCRPHEESRISMSRPVQTLELDSGILDGKFLQSLEDPKIYCTASSSGHITLFHLQRHEEESFRLKKLSSHGNSDFGLCLSLAWDSYKIVEDLGTISSRIVSSYSKGTLALHNIVIHIDDSGELNHVSAEETNRWDGHSLFGRATEVWTTCFATNRFHNTYENIVISGADDCKLKLWDVRTTNRPIHDIQTTEAGVTAVAYHPNLEHVFASGSYDESICVWDMRKMDSKTPTQKIENIGGGIWRLKWHPCHVSRILTGTMDAGGKILNFSCLEPLAQDDGGDTPYSTVPISFTAHKSLTYGADWIYCENCKISSAGTCSFYDRQVFIWSA